MPVASPDWLSAIARQNRRQQALKNLALGIGAIYILAAEQAHCAEKRTSSAVAGDDLRAEQKLHAQKTGKRRTKKLLYPV